MSASPGTQKAGISPAATPTKSLPSAAASTTSAKSANPPATQQGKGKREKGPCPHLCTLVPIDVPAPEKTQAVLHPRKDVFVLKVAKVGPNGDRRCRMELELVTPKPTDKAPPSRVDTRETQFDPECPCCTKTCGKRKK